MINNIKNNTISEALSKQKLDALNKITKGEIKNKSIISSQKKLLDLFDDLLEVIFNNKNKNKNNNVSESENENEYENDNENDNDNDNDNADDDDNDDDDGDHDEQY